MSVKYAFRSRKSRAHALADKDCRLQVTCTAAFISGQGTLLPRNNNVNNRKVQSENKEMEKCNPDVCIYINKYDVCKYL